MARGSGKGSRGSNKLRNPEGFGVSTNEDAIKVPAVVPAVAPAGDKAMEELYAGKTIGSNKQDPNFITPTKNADGSFEFQGRKYIDGKLQGANDPAATTPSDKAKRTKALNAYHKALKNYLEGGPSSRLRPEDEVGDAARKVVEVFLKIPGYAMGLSARPYDGQFLPREGSRSDMNSIKRALSANDRGTILKAINASGSDTAKDAYRWFALSKATEENKDGTIWYSRAWREIANRVK